MAFHTKVQDMERLITIFERDIPSIGENPAFTNVSNIVAGLRSNVDEYVDVLKKADKKINSLTGEGSADDVNLRKFNELQNEINTILGNIKLDSEIVQEQAKDQQEQLEKQREEAAKTSVPRLSTQGRMSSAAPVQQQQASSTAGQTQEQQFRDFMQRFQREQSVI